MTLALFGGWPLNVSEVAAEPPDPFVVNATDDLVTALIIGFAPFFLALAG